MGARSAGACSAQGPPTGCHAALGHAATRRAHAFVPPALTNARGCRGCLQAEAFRTESSVWDKRYTRLRDEAATASLARRASELAEREAHVREQAGFEAQLEGQLRQYALRAERARRGKAAADAAVTLEAEELRGARLQVRRR